MAYEINAAAPDESFLFYSNAERDKELGCIGHLRGDFGRSGNEFWTTWWEHVSELKTQDFREKLDLFVNGLREQGLLKDRSSMAAYCYKHQEARIKGAWHEDVYGFQSKLGQYRFYVRCFPLQGDYNFYIYCYDSEKERVRAQDDRTPQPPKKKRDQPER
jgi:hypothetical protein